MKLIGIAGKKNSGKNTLAECIEAAIDANTDLLADILSFADPLKDAASLMLPFEYRDLVFGDQEDKNTLIKPFGITVRKFLQKLGTDFAHSISKDFWITLMEERLDELGRDSNSVYIFPDVRFKNEANWIKKNGGFIIHIIDPFDTSEDSHSSEVIDFECDSEVINDKTLGIENLEEIALKIAKSL